MTTHHEDDFTFSSDVLSEVKGTTHTLPVFVQIDFDVTVNHAYDTPHGPTGNSATIENIVVVGIYHQYEDLSKLYHENQDFFKEVQSNIMVRERRFLDRAR